MHTTNDVKENAAKTLGVYGAYLLEGAWLVPCLREALLVEMQVLQQSEHDAYAAQLLEVLRGTTDWDADGAAVPVTMNAAVRFLAQPSWRGYLDCLFPTLHDLVECPRVYRHWSLLRPRSDNPEEQHEVDVESTKTKAHVEITQVMGGL